MAHHSDNKPAHCLPSFQFVVDDSRSIIFQIVVDDSCSKICDDVPVRCTISVIPVDGRSPPQVLSGSLMPHWMEDDDGLPSLIDCSFRDKSLQEDDYGPLVRDRYGRIVGSPISSPRSSHRSRRSMVESVRRKIEENASHFHTDRSDEGEIVSVGTCADCADSHASSSSTSPNRPQVPGSAPEDRFQSPIHLPRDFKRANITVDAADLQEIHSPSTPGQSSPLFDLLPPPSSLSPVPPSHGSSKVVRCCAMAKYIASNYRSVTPERDAGGGGQCTYHRWQPCPARAGSHCSQNRQDGDVAEQFSVPRSPGLNAERSCKYHDSLLCPVLAGVYCRGEIQMNAPSSGSSSSLSSPNTSKSFPSSPVNQPAPAASPGRSREGAQPPSKIAPPPRSPRSRSPVRRDKGITFHAI